MRNIFKIIRHYLSLTTIVVLLLLLINCLVGFCWIYKSMQYKNYNASLNRISSELVKDNRGFSLSQKGQEILDNNYEWSMLLNDAGDVVWSMYLPSDVPTSYTASEIASFSKWYLKDYPVYVWAHPDGLFVAAGSQHSAWKLQIEAPQKMLENLPYWGIILLISNILGAILLSLLVGLRFFSGFKQIVCGIEALAQKQPINLKVKGVLKGLATNINNASNELVAQQKQIEKRDTARNNWIAGVSHDIRTPLSMIMGYASSLEERSDLPPDVHKQLTVIRTQSERIRNLVSDLNLTVKLEYNMQPLHSKPFYLSELLRKVVVHYLNTLEDDKYTLNLTISPLAQHFMIEGDCHLFERALCNLIDNSMKHNPNGCEITLNLFEKDQHILLEVTDNGIGFEQSTLDKLNHSSEMPTGVSHGLGLYIVKQIVQAVGAQIHYGNGTHGSCIHISFLSTHTPS